MGLAHDFHDDDGGHPDDRPRSAAAVVLHPTYMLDSRLQRRMQRTLDQIRHPSWHPTAILEQLRDRIKAIALDMTAFNQRCIVESNTPRASQGPPRPATNADTALGAEAASQASETKEEI